MKSIDLKLFERKRGVKEPDTLRIIKILVVSQSATISPPLGPTLGQFGINIKEFCDKFNEQSKIYDVDIVLNVTITLLKTKSFNFKIGLPSTSFLINEEEVEIENENMNRYLSLISLYKIVNLKKTFEFYPETSIASSILGTIKSMNVFLINNLN